MSSDHRIPLLEQQVRELSDRIAQFETQVGRLRSLADMDREPFTYLCLEADLTERQETQILDLMEEAYKSLKEPSPMGPHDFERRVYQIVPSHDGNYGFAATIVSTLHRQKQWREVFEHMKANGMNIHDRSADD